MIVSIACRTQLRATEYVELDAGQSPTLARPAAPLAACVQRIRCVDNTAEIQEIHILYRVASCTFFHTPYLWNRSRQNEIDFTKMFVKFLGIKVKLQFLCSC